MLSFQGTVSPLTTLCLSLLSLSVCQTLHHPEWKHDFTTAEYTRLQHTPIAYGKPQLESKMERSDETPTILLHIL